MFAVLVSCLCQEGKELTVVERMGNESAYIGTKIVEETWKGKNYVGGSELLHPIQRSPFPLRTSCWYSNAGRRGD